MGHGRDGNPRTRNLAWDGVLIFNCCITNYHKIELLKPQHYYLTVVVGQEPWHSLAGSSAQRCSQIATKVSAALQSSPGPKRMRLLQDALVPHWLPTQSCPPSLATWASPTQRLHQSAQAIRPCRVSWQEVGHGPL